MIKLQNIAKTMTLTALVASSSPRVAHAGFTTNDLYLGFSQPSSQSDYIIDLGQPKTIGVGGSTVMDLGSHFSQSTFNSVFTGANGVVMAVVGGSTAVGAYDVYATQIRSSGIGNPALPGSSITATHSVSQMSGGASQVASILSST